jgi:UDP-N-acetylglucosamine 2-epimerase (non-hydrolysing)
MFYINHNSDNFTTIDCCLTDEVKDDILDEIKEESSCKGISRFISTHPDEDHILGLVDYEDKLGINNFYRVNNDATKKGTVPEKNFLSLFTAINAMAEKYDMPILYSCHPRSRKRLEASGFKLDRRVIQHEPLGFHDYNCLQMNAFAVVSDSGTLPEESSFFTSVGHPFPAVCIRTSTERPEALDKACFFIAGIDSGSLLQAVDTAVAMNAAGDHGTPVPDYVDENVSTKVVKIIQSYTGIVNKMVWRKF